MSGELERRPSATVASLDELDGQRRYADAEVLVARKARLSDVELLPLMRGRLDAWRAWGIALGPAEHVPGPGRGKRDDESRFSDAERKDRERARKIARVPPEIYEAHRQQDDPDELTLAGLLYAANRQAPPAPGLDTPPLPDGRYRCIVIDPPWPMDRIVRRVRPAQTAALAYPTWTLEQIANLPIADLVDPAGCHIYLWVTHRFMPAGLDLLGGWGARYECALTWVKPGGPTPFSWQYNTEHALFARAGDGLELDRNGLKLSIDAPATGHSRKPAEFYDRVREASPGPRLDMFDAGREVDGFEAWGKVPDAV